MTDDDPQNSADARPAFPYHVLWAGYGNAEVTLRELEDNADEYRIFNEATQRFSPDVAHLEISMVEVVLERHEFTLEMAKAIWLVGCYYLAPKQAEPLGLDPVTSRKLLSRAAYHAQRLEWVLAKLSPKVLAALTLKRPLDPTTGEPFKNEFHELYREVCDFGEMARHAVSELQTAEGRPRNHERDTMIRLFIEIMRDGGFDDLRISNGTKARGEPHLAGKAGSLLLDLIALVEPNWNEAWLAPKVKRVRRKMSSHKTGAKTRTT